MKHFIWGRWRSDKELQEIAREMNQIGRRIEGVAELVAELEEARKRNPRGLVF